MRINEAKIVRSFQEEEKAGGGFGGKEIKDCEAKNMATLCYRHRKYFI